MKQLHSFLFPRSGQYFSMKNLMTRKLVFDVLMAFVLAFSVQGIADALTLKEVSDKVQSKRDGAEFEITFSVGLKSQAATYTTSGPRRLVNSGTPADTTVTPNLEANPEGNDFIDSQGHELLYLADGRSLRVIHGTPGFIPSTGTQVILTKNAQPLYANQPYVSDGGDPPSYTLGPATLNLPTTGPTVTHVDASGFAYTATGAAVYVQSGTGARDNPGTSPTNENDPFTYQRLRALPQAPLHIYDRFDYNNEQITITSSEAITLVNKKDRQNVINNGTSGTMMETADFAKLEGTVTLVCTPAAGTYTITITDSTPAADYPRDIAPPTRSLIQFTLYATTETPITVGTPPSILITSTNTQYQRVDTAEEIETVSERFTITNVDDDTRIRYRVAKGSGTLYVGTIDEEYITPKSDLSVHQDANVFLKMNGTDNEVSVSVAGSDRRTFSATVVYEYSGGQQPQQQQPQQQQPQQQQQQQRTLSLSPTVLSGAPATPTPLTATVSPAVAGVPVTFFLNQVALSQVVTNAAGQAQTSIILPSSSGGSVVAAASGYTSATASISITGAGTPDTPTPDPTPTVLEPASIEIYDGDEQQGELNRRLDEDLVVEVLDRNNRGVSFETISLRVVEGSGRFSPSRPRTSSNGRASFSFTPRSPGSQGTIEIEASVGDLSPVIFTVNVGEPPDAIVIVSGNNQSGRPGERLANPFVVEVVDENDDPVSGVTVSFRVTAGGGTLSATSATTNNGGRAQTTFTLGDEFGDNTVVASVSGLSDRVTFKARAGATVLVDSDKRAPMYWVGSQNGTLHRLVDGEVEDLATTVMGVTSIAVDSANGLLYFAVETGPNKGTIRRSGLNGRNAQTLKKLTAVPMGIAVDSTGSTVYWTNSRGRIQSIAAQGSAQLANLLSNLANPTAIALSNGFMYWGEPLGRIRRASLTGDRITPENIATGLGEPLSLAIAKGKVYWLERDAGGGGRLQRANLDGSGIQQVKAFASGVPTSFAIDSSDNKIYWTRSTGKIQRSNLAGKFTTDIVNGLMGPGSIALGVAATPASVVTQTRQPTPTTTTQTTTPTSYSKYDVNRDGAVNNGDSKAVAGAVGQSGAGITNPRTDVDGSGTVDVTDLILVLANLDDDVAAPAIDVDLQAMDLDFDRIQEQVEVLLSSGDRSHAAQRALMYLQHLLASARPDATVLLANYPNPFNPETWIPYHLASSTDVKLRIYDARGTLVRELVLGHQSAGYYTSRSRAAYWDGRNALGERVASGIYFYQLQADEISPLRKMVILK